MGSRSGSLVGGPGSRPGLSGWGLGPLGEANGRVPVAAPCASLNRFYAHLEAGPGEADPARILKHSSHTSRSDRPGERETLRAWIFRHVYAHL